MGFVSCNFISYNSFLQTYCVPMSKVQYCLCARTRERESLLACLSLLNFLAWHRVSTQGHLSASSIPGARRQEASWEQITPWPDFSHSLARATEREWGQMHIADKSLQQIPILSLRGGSRKWQQGNRSAEPPPGAGLARPWDGYR